MITDPTLLRIGEAVQLNHAGEREAARLRFQEIWEEIGGERGPPSTLHARGRGGRRTCYSGPARSRLGEALR